MRRPIGLEIILSEVLICTHCGKEISRPVNLDWIGASCNPNSEDDFEVEDHEYGDFSLVPEGFALITLKPIHEGQPGVTAIPVLDFSPQIWMNPDDLLDRLEHINRHMNCRCGSKVGYREDDSMHYDLRYFIPAPHKTKWRSNSK